MSLTKEIIQKSRDINAKITKSDLNFNDNELKVIQKNFDETKSIRRFTEIKNHEGKIISRQWRIPDYMEGIPMKNEPFEDFKQYYDRYIKIHIVLKYCDIFGYEIIEQPKKKVENKIQEVKQLPQEIIDSRNKVLEQLKPKPETKQLPQEIIDSRNKVLEQLKPKPKTKSKTKSNGSNKWVEHVRAYAKANNISYACAISEASKTYRK
jgi:hypothetical protein